MPDQMDWLFRRLILFLLEDIFSILFCVIFPNFKVLDIILEVVYHILNVRVKNPKDLEDVSYI
jgi:hypothetical protein